MTPAPRADEGDPATPRPNLAARSLRRVRRPSVASAAVAYASVVDVMLVLVRDHQVLLALRQGTGYADGLWNLPSGKLDEGEHALDAVVREAREEIGVRLDPDDLRLTGVVHGRNPEGEGRLGLFFATSYRPDRHGEPYNAEPHKCAGLGWFPLDRPPPDTVPYITAGLRLHTLGEPFTTFGWP